MKRNLFLLIGFIGLIGLLSACEKDETKVVMLENPIPPSFISVPDLTMQRVNANQTLIFTGNPVDPGFQASATYYLEASTAGSNFADPLVLYSGMVVDTIKFKVSDLNSLLLRKFPADQVSSVDFRIRAQLVVDAGTGAVGTSSNPLQYMSETKTVNVTLYGLPRLDLINSGMTQKIESPAGDGNYSGFVKINQTNPFTLIDPDTNLEYGGQAGTLVLGGSAIVPPSPNGWYILVVDVNNLTYSFTEHRMGVVGSATPNGWDAPDQKMDYNSQSGYWYITLDLVPGFFKFRRNDGWDFNFGYINAPGALPWIDLPLQRGGVGNDLEITQAGSYTITLTIAPDQQSAKSSVIKN